MTPPSIYSTQSPTCSISSFPSSDYTFIRKKCPVLELWVGLHYFSSFPKSPESNKSCLFHPQQTSCHFQNRPCHSPSPDGFTNLSLLEYPYSETVSLCLSLQIQLLPSRHPYWFPQILFCTPSTIYSWQHVTICYSHSNSVFPPDPHVS